MYLMWDPAIPGVGQSRCWAAATISAAGQINSRESTCLGSIPVPLAYVNWWYSGDAMNTLVGNGANTWTLCCGVPAPVTVVNSTAYPVWSGPFN